MSNSKITENLLDWFDLNKRILPWRTHRTAYTTWISETMLQQTRVNTVIPYYTRFLEEFPNIRSLAEASIDKINKVWEGLGYYSRARNLKKGAEFCVANFKGELPEHPADLIRVPGIGPYTCGAVSSMIHGYPMPAVDGNAIRVTSRLFALYINTQDSAAKKTVYDKLTEILPEQRPGDFNEAVMDLGACICTPRSPGCNICPVSSFCGAFAMSVQNILPLRSKKKEIPSFPYTVLILTVENQIYINRRPETGLLSGLYEFILYPEKLSQIKLQDLLSQSFPSIHPEKLKYNFLGESKHIFSHLQWEMTGYQIDLDSKTTQLISALQNAKKEDLISDKSKTKVFLKPLQSVMTGRFYSREEAALLPFPSALKIYTRTLFSDQIF